MTSSTSSGTTPPLRGEVWTYAPQGAPGSMPVVIPVVIVSSDGINESSRPWLLAVPITPESPEDVLGVSIPDHGWVHAGVIIRTYRPWLTEQRGQLVAATLDSLDEALRSALDL